MLDKLIDIDNLYVCDFSKVLNTKYGSIYYDEFMKDKYIHNYFFMKDYNKENIKFYIDYCLRNNYSHISFFTKKFKEDFNILDDYDKEELGYYISDFNIINNIKFNSKYIIKIVDHNNIKDLVALFYLDSYRYGEEYATKNCIRYSDVLLSNSNIKYYLIYDGVIPVGFISSFLYKDILKVEDFYISKSYRNKGYGSSLLRYVLNEYKDNNIVYLTALKNDSVINMYQNMGFKYIGESYIIRKILK